MTLGERIMYRGSIFSICETTVQLPDGRTFVGETVLAPDVVRVYPMLDNARLALIRERRHELGRWVLRVVSGRLEADEEPEEAAARELEEELGLVGGVVQVAGRSRPILKVRSDVHHVHVTGAHEGQSRPEPDEVIERVVVPIADLPRLVWNGEIEEDVVALHLLRLAGAAD